MTARLTKALSALIIAGAATGAAATVLETPRLDPWVPPTQRKAATRPPATGADLKTQVERKLFASFDAADVDRVGTVTRDQARAAGLGFIVNHFDRIDSAGSGRVGFDDLKRYLRARGADL